MEPTAPVNPSNRNFLGLTLLQFLLHLAVVYLLANFVVAWLSAQFHNLILPLLGMPSSQSRFAFAFNHLLLFSVLCGLAAGIVAATYRHRAAQFVWIVPVIILAYKFLTFPAGLFQDRFALAFHHYLAGGFLIPEFHTFQDVFMGWNSDYERGLDQVQFTVPVYVGLAYGVGSWAGARLGIRFPLFGAPPIPKSRTGDAERTS